MNLTQKCLMLIGLLFLFPISFSEASTIQYGSVYDDNLPLKPIRYVLESEGINGKALSIQGTITVQCKGDGCWFILKDETGEVLVDLKPHDITTPLGIEGRKVKLNGRTNTGNNKVKMDAISIVILE